MQKFLELLKVKFDIIAVSATWLTDSDDIKDYYLPDYELLIC